MFCGNCGKEIPDNARFCNHCGAVQNTRFAQNTQSAYPNTGTQQAANPQPVYPAPPPQKPKSGGFFKIVVVAVVVAAAFSIGYFATGANTVKEPTPFDTPSSYHFDELEPPSIKEDPAENDLPLTETLESKMFYLSSDYGSSSITFYYDESGIVEMIIGSIRVADKTVTSVDDLKSDAENANTYLEQLGVVGSFVEISDDPDSTEYSESFIFCSLSSDTNIAELAAAFVGFETDSGKITIDSAETAMLGFGYSLL